MRHSELAAFHGTEAALLFNSGYDANYGVLSSLPAAHDLVLYDELVHASIHDGMRAGRGRRAAFGHNDVAHVRRLLEAARGGPAPASTVPVADIFVVVESIYSMDGDAAPLAALVALCDTFRAQLIVDEVGRPVLACTGRHVGRSNTTVDRRRGAAAHGLAGARHRGGGAPGRGLCPIAWAGAARVCTHPHLWQGRRGSRCRCRRLGRAALVPDQLCAVPHLHHVPARALVDSDPGGVRCHGRARRGAACLAFRASGRACGPKRAGV